jgi:hypothetical protein
MPSHVLTDTSGMSGCAVSECIYRFNKRRIQDLKE